MNYLRKSVALIGIFIVAFFFCPKPNEAAFAIVPLATKNAPASCFKIVHIDDCAGKMERRHYVRSLADLENEGVIWGRIVGKVYGFATSDIKSSILVMAGRQQRPEGTLYVLCHRPTLDNGGFSASCVCQAKPDLSAVDINLMDDQPWPVGSDKFRAREFHLFLSRFGSILGRVGGNFGISQAFANNSQLSPKQSNLSGTDYNQQESNDGQRVRRSFQPSFILFLLVSGIVSFCGFFWLSGRPLR